MRISVENLTHIYGEGLSFATVALEDVSCTFEPGEFAAVIGHTGSGKTTLVQHLNGIMKPSSGRVLAGGADISKKGRDIMALRHKIGIVFQYPEYQLFEETVIKDVEFGPRNLGMSEEECRARAERALRLVGLDPEEKGGYSPFDLSGGEKRRVAIAGVLAMEPEVLILDEPTAGLDPQGHRDILSMIEAVRKDRSLTIIIVSHNMDDVARLADHVLVMHRGRLVMDGGPREVFAREEELRGMGLGLPSGAEFLSMLRERGVSVDTGVLTIEETEEKIAELFGR